MMSSPTSAKKKQDRITVRTNFNRDAFDMLAYWEMKCDRYVILVRCSSDCPVAVAVLQKVTQHNANISGSCLHSNPDHFTKEYVGGSFRCGRAFQPFVIAAIGR